jgi:hypothetical protein
VLSISLACSYQKALAILEIVIAKWKIGKYRKTLACKTSAKYDKRTYFARTFHLGK